MTQKMPQKFNKKLAYGKVPQKFQNSWGGVRPGLENTQIKAAFLFVEPPNHGHWSQGVVRSHGTTQEAQGVLGDPMGQPMDPRLFG